MKPAAEVRRLAYEAVASSAVWLMERAGPGGNFVDDYTRNLASEVGTPMPIAECIMALLNLKENDYIPLELPAPDDKEVNRLAIELLASIKKHGLIGLPYVRPAKGAKHPVFVDAINYSLAAIAKLVRLHTKDGSIVLAPETLANLQRKGRELVELLVAKRTEYRVPNVGTRRAWSWTGDEDVDKIRPPSLFFTTQAATTLLEVLFEAPTILGENDSALSSKVMAAIIDAKKYIIESLQWKDSPEKIGWVNINLDAVDFPGGKSPEERERFLRGNGYPYFSRAHEGDPRISLYAIECLAFFRYYQTEKFFASRREELRREFGDFWGEFADIASQEVTNMSAILERFLSIMESKEDAQVGSINFDPIRIELPVGFNEPDGRDSVPGSWYFDGTVPYNALSALTFGSEQFGFRLRGDAPQTAGGVNESHIIRLVEFIIENAFDKVCFLHLDRQIGQRVRAIYATRAAIGPLLSAGLLPPVTRISTAINEARVRQLARELSSALGLIVHDKSNGGNERERLSIDTLRGLLLAAFCLGTVTNFFADEDIFSKPHSGKGQNKTFWNLRIASPAYDLKSLVKVNGVKLIDLLAHIGTGAESTDIDELVRALVEDEYLLDVVRSWLTAAKMEKNTTGRGLVAKLAEGETRILRPDIAEMGTALIDLVDRMVAAAREEQRKGLGDQLDILRKDLLG